MDAERVLSDPAALRSFVETFVDLTTANIEAQREAVSRLQALLDGEFYEYDAAAEFIQAGDEIRWPGEAWQTVTASEWCLLESCWHIAFANGEGVHAARGDRFRIRRPRCLVAEVIAEGEAFERGE